MLYIVIYLEVNNNYNHMTEFIFFLSITQVMKKQETPTLETLKLIYTVYIYIYIYKSQKLLEKFS